MAKSFVSGVAALALLSSGARAQDFFSPGPAVSFAGPEAGVDLGAAVGGTGNVSPTGAGVGLHAGYMLQNGQVVGGVEGDAMLGSVNGSGQGGSLSQNWLSSLRVRGGWAFGNVLAYGTVGPAWAASTFERGGFAYDKSLHGYTLGVGGEVGVTRNITARAEIRHYDFGAATYYMPSGVQKLSTGNNFLLVGVGAHF
ncbi:MAG: porin family protein [Pseudomonadota bacterium]|nr:porin family protein [Pseudomonadota bacterium]